jgi:hypothetical protein
VAGAKAFAGVQLTASAAKVRCFARRTPALAFSPVANSATL